MKIGENLKKLRKRANLTQQDAAQMLGFKNHTGYAHWEGDRNSPSVGDLERIAAVFNTSVYEVLGITPFKESNTEASPEDIRMIKRLEHENAELTKRLAESEAEKNRILISFLKEKGIEIPKAKGVIHLPENVNLFRKLNPMYAVMQKGLKVAV